MEVAVQISARHAQQRHIIDDSSKVGEARRAAHTLANFELDTDTAGKVSIAATELANNLLRHAGGGELLIQRLGDEAQTTVELLAIDRGRGMHDIERCMADGYSTAGTPGTGLGAVRRLSSEFDIHSEPGHGTVVMARFGAVQPVRHGAVNLPLDGEVICGDAWQLARSDKCLALFVIDGLGHGAFAGEAARAGVDAFALSPCDEPKDILVRANGLMSRTRGGAAACARIVEDRVSFAGIGNISATLVSAEKSQGLVSHNGTLGIHKRASQQFEYQRAQGAVLIMHSDGISARWELKDRTALLARHPAIIAGVIYRDHARERDDSTIVVVAW
jgi:anti-sigma regulatory factor (Ser/Thr protein kinase)